jgi:membrane-associated phospholipid phosphatase
LGGYQPYFYFQHFTFKRSREFSGKFILIDEKIKLRPAWIWIYTVFYYPVVVIVAVMAAHNHRQFIYIAFSYMVMLAVMIVFYVLFPVKTPAHWREYDRNKSLSHRFLYFIQAIDGTNNCFPSGHAAISVITAYHMATYSGTILAGCYAFLIILSCLYCKQHYIIDVIAGAILGFLIIQFYLRIL